MRRQFSLRWFLLAALLAGMLLGVAVPPIIRLANRWAPRAAGSRRPAPPPPSFSMPESSSAYYESGETPLR